jgi:hypothetical protein
MLEPAVDVGVIQAEVLLPQPAQVADRNAELVCHPGIAGAGGGEGVGVRGDTLGSENGQAGPVDRPDARIRADAGGWSDDIELSRVLLTEQRRQVGKDPLRCVSWMSIVDTAGSLQDVVAARSVDRAGAKHRVRGASRRAGGPRGGIGAGRPAAGQALTRPA